MLMTTPCKLPCNFKYVVPAAMEQRSALQVQAQHINMLCQAAELLLPRLIGYAAEL
jgi:hypothetical protein